MEALHFNPILNVCLEDLVFVAMVGGDGGGERTLSGIHRRTKEEHRNNYKDLKGSTKRTLCGIVLFKLNTFLVMFLQVPSIDSTCFLPT